MSAITFTYVFGNSVTYMTSRNKEENIGFRTYSCMLGTDSGNLFLTEEFMGAVTEMFDSFPVENIYFGSRLILTTSETSNVSLGPWKNGFDSFSENQISEAERVMLISSQATEADELILKRKGNKAYYNDKFDESDSIKEYTIIGTFEYWDHRGIIPYTTFIEDGYELTELTIITSRRLSDAENTEIFNILNAFPYNTGTNFNYPSMYIDEEMTQSWMMTVILALIYGVSIITYLYIIKYIVETNRYYFNIHAFFGASRFGLTVRFFVEEMLLISVLNVIALFFHYALYDVLFSKINLITQIEYYSSDYATIFAVLLIVSGIITLPYSWKFAKSSVAEVFRGD